MSPAGGTGDSVPLLDAPICRDIPLPLGPEIHGAWGHAYLFLLDYTLDTRFWNSFPKPPSPLQGPHGLMPASDLLGQTPGPVTHP